MSYQFMLTYHIGSILNDTSSMDILNIIFGILAALVQALSVVLLISFPIITKRNTDERILGKFCLIRHHYICVMDIL